MICTLYSILRSSVVQLGREVCLVQCILAVFTTSAGVGWMLEKQAQHPRLQPPGERVTVSTMFNKIHIVHQTTNRNPETLVGACR